MKNHYGKGYASESFGIVFNYLFNICKIRKVTIGTCVEAEKMTNLALKVGMVRDGIRKKHYVLGNIEHDVIHLQNISVKFFKINSNLVIQYFFRFYGFAQLSRRL